MSSRAHNKKSDTLHDLFKKYAALELHIQRIITGATGHYCAECTARCCKEHFCKESIESPFLTTLVKKQKMVYHAKNGWMSPSGCRLAYGRPLVCYDFFCDAISDSFSFQATNLKEIVREFVSIGNRAHGASHLICIDNVDIISSTKIDTMLKRINTLKMRLITLSLTKSCIQCTVHK
jgi:hypothetical protein